MESFKLEDICGYFHRRDAGGKREVFILLSITQVQLGPSEFVDFQVGEQGRNLEGLEFDEVVNDMVVCNTTW